MTRAPVYGYRRMPLRRARSVFVGADPAPLPAEETSDLSATLAQIRRSVGLPLIVTAMITGAAIAVGSGLVARYVFKKG